MRYLLMLGFLLYNIVTFANRLNNYDYDDNEGNKRHSVMEDHRNWRKRVLGIASEDKNDWERKRDYEGLRYIDDSDLKKFSGIENSKGPEFSSNYRSPRRHDEIERVPLGFKSSDSSFLEKEPDKRSSGLLNCKRPHEKYEACFAGCASVSCDNPRDRLRPCYPFCEPGCICMHPYVRDDRTHKCVLPDDCTKGLKGIPDLEDDT